MTTDRRSPTLAVSAILLLVLGAAAPACADWYIVANPITGNPEAVWTNTPPGQSATNVLYSYLDGDKWADSTTLSQDGKDSSTPVLAFDASGERKVAWETYNSGQILMKTLPSSGGSWSASVTVSASSESAALPTIVVVGDDTWVSYETVAAFTGAHSVQVAKVDSGGMVDRTLVRTTSYTASVYTWIHSD